LIALLVALGIAVLIGSQPWAPTTLAPQLSVAPDIDVAVGDAVELPPAQQLALAPAQQAATGGTRFVSGEATADEGDGRPQLSIAAARVVVRPAANSPAGAAPAPPQSDPAAPPSPVPVVVPVAVPEPAAIPAPEAITLPGRSPSGSAGQLSGPVGAGMGPVGGAGEAIEIFAGDEYALAFSFYVQSTAYRPPGEENLILQVRDATSGIPSFAVQLWDDDSGQRGLWSSGEAMGGERFLALIEDGVWHQAVLCFKASEGEDGFYLLLLDGQPIDARARVELLPESGDGQLEVGLFREGQQVLGASDIFFGPTELGESLESVLP
jgi:Polysaccharide lyase